LILTTGKYYCDFTIDIVDKSTCKTYGIIQVMNNLNLVPGVKVLDQTETDELTSLDNELEQQLYAYGKIASKYLAPFFDGDFSLLRNMERGV